MEKTVEGACHERFVTDLSWVLSDAEDMLKRSGAETGDKARELRSQAESKLQTAKLRLQRFQDEAFGRAKAAAIVTDDYVRDNAWQVIGVATVIGLAIGLLLNRRS